MLLFFAWIGMVGTVVFGGIVIVTQSDGAVIGMLLSMGLWMLMGIACIRERRMG
jgi:hypothetical protein